MKTVFVSGCYDLLHAGHVEFLQAARALGDRLAVCIPTDGVLRAHRKWTPVLSAQRRAKTMSAIVSSNRR
jgi:cytidyltransferase-like protein